MRSSAVREGGVGAQGAFFFPSPSAGGKPRGFACCQGGGGGAAGVYHT